MVLYYHLIMTAYGFWLPNDPRGSWSDFVWAWELYKFADATKVDDGRSRAHDRHDVELRKMTKKELNYSPVRFDEAQRNLIGEGFGRAVEEGKYKVLACCIGYDHCHLVVERHSRSIEKIATHLKSKATMALTRAGEHPLKDHRLNSGSIPTPWAEGAWSVFIDDYDHMLKAIRYVKHHPMKEGLPRQVWGFVQSRSSGRR